MNRYLLTFTGEDSKDLEPIAFVSKSAADEEAAWLNEGFRANDLDAKAEVIDMESEAF